ncbi:sugar MFS transporter [Curtobacterium sp. MCSS17_008]|uniref:MFS transporter n=1 Tax=Curtobacterium sp. MCSS17_008 TaxID=2175647 RepID=UPI001C64B905|nr:hypothetical protein [Curtobacterium sp. MCSS17_008]
MSAVFVACGVAQASWAVQLPWFRAVLALSDGDTGLLTAALSASCCAGLAVGSCALRRVLAPRVLSFAAVAIVVGAVLLQAVPATRSLPVLTTALAVLGLGIGTADVAANVLGGSVEQRTGRVLLPVLHAGYSAGLVTGAVLGLLAGEGTPSVGAVPLGLCVASALTGLVALRVAEGRADGSRSEPTPTARGAGVPVGRRSAWHAVVPLGVVLALAAAVEGIGDTWVPVLAADRTAGPVGPSPALVYLAFTAAVLVSRLVVHLAGRRWPRLVLLRAALLVGGSGLVLVVVDGAALPVAVALWGAGTGVAFPLLVSEAAARGAASPRVVPAVTAAGYAGFLLGPAGVGLLSQSTGHGVIPVLSVVLLLAALLVAVAVLRPGSSVSVAPLPVSTAPHPSAADPERRSDHVSRLAASSLRRWSARRRVRATRPGLAATSTHPTPTVGTHPTTGDVRVPGGSRGGPRRRRSDRPPR